MIVCENEQEHLETSVYILPGQNKVNIIHVVFYWIWRSEYKTGRLFCPIPKQNEKHNVSSRQTLHSFFASDTWNIMRRNSNDKFRLWASDTADNSLRLFTLCHVHFPCYGCWTWSQSGRMKWGRDMCQGSEEFRISCTCMMKLMPIAVTCHEASADIPKFSDCS